MHACMHAFLGISKVSEAYNKLLLLYFYDIPNNATYIETASISKLNAV